MDDIDDFGIQNFDDSKILWSEPISMEDDLDDAFARDDEKSDDSNILIEQDKPSKVYKNARLIDKADDQERNFKTVKMSLTEARKYIPVDDIYSFEDVNKEFERLEKVFKNCNPNVHIDNYPDLLSKEDCAKSMQLLHSATFYLQQNISPPAPQIINMEIKFYNLDSFDLKQKILSFYSKIDIDPNIVFKILSKYKHDFSSLCNNFVEDYLQNDKPRKFIFQDFKAHCKPDLQKFVEKCLKVSKSFIFYFQNVKYKLNFEDISVKGWFTKQSELESEISWIIDTKTETDADIIITSVANLLFPLNFEAIDQEQFEFLIKKNKNFLFMKYNANLSLSVNHSGNILFKHRQTYIKQNLEYKLERCFYEQRQFYWKYYSDFRTKMIDLPLPKPC